MIGLRQTGTGRHKGSHGRNTSPPTKECHRSNQWSSESGHTLVTWVGPSPLVRKGSQTHPSGSDSGWPSRTQGVRGTHRPSYLPVRNQCLGVTLDRPHWRGPEVPGSLLVHLRHLETSSRRREEWWRRRRLGKQEGGQERTRNPIPTHSTRKPLRLTRSSSTEIGANKQREPKLRDAESDGECRYDPRLLCQNPCTSPTSLARGNL